MPTGVMQQHTKPFRSEVLSILQGTPFRHCLGTLVIVALQDRHATWVPSAVWLVLTLRHRFYQPGNIKATDAATCNSVLR